ncbi:hypothetical protein C4J81_12590 [Deltaproteobacteria bacterium Smac51]|nr:hypothetical protein C4J81_12590 [Deltaproteobacteria bacterium Smac51]
MGKGCEMRKAGRSTSPSPGSVSWIISFADLVTILLTFLVLIIGITTQTPRTDFLLKEGVLEGEADYIRRGDGTLMFSDKSLLAPVIELMENLDSLPENVMFDQEEFKRAVFQLDPARTPDYQRLEEAARGGVEFSRDNRGLVIKWDRALLFPEGGAILMDDNVLLLEKLAVFLQNVQLPVSIESHTNPLSPLEGGNDPAAYDLSLRRSKVVMEFLTGLGLAEERFRLGGYGGSRPRTEDSERAWENSRLEIIIYRPEQSSWRG